MTALFNRLGALESRCASSIRPSIGVKRRRNGWECAECRAKRSFHDTGKGEFRSGRIRRDLATPAQSGVFPHDVEGRPGEKVSRRLAAFGRVNLADQKGNVALQTTAPTSGYTDSDKEALWEQDRIYLDLPTEIDQQPYAPDAFHPQEAQSDDLASTQAQPPEPGHSLESRQQRILRWQEELALTYKHELKAGLQRQEADRVLRAFLAAAQDHDFIKSIPSTTFSQILHLIRPAAFVSSIRDVSATFRHRIPRMLQQPVHHSLVDYVSVVQDVVNIRRAAGGTLNIADYTSLLACTCAVGDGSAAKSIWTDMQEDGIIPDTACYNLYMGAIVHNGEHLGRVQKKLRVIKFHKSARSVSRLGSGFTGYRIGEKGIKQTTIDIFNEMLRHEAIADQDSFICVMTAAGREGDLATVKAVLRKVWLVDVDALMSGTDEQEFAPHVQLGRTSPLYPSSRLLFTIAHVFGINNDIPTALRVVDYVSRLYSISISRNTWAQLFEWTFVLAVPRYGSSALRWGHKTGQLPKQSVLNLWHTMTSPPYNIKPTIVMYDQLLRNLTYRSHMRKMLDFMEEGRGLYRSSIKAARQAFHALERAVDEARERGLLHPDAEEEPVKR
ncbi:hypothetical protein LTR66_013749, partial [Elasticomyces elasticus]